MVLQLSLIFLGLVLGALITAVWLSRRKGKAVDAKSDAALKTVPSESVKPSEASLQDNVTGLYNKKHLLQRLQDNMSRCDRERKSMAVILWDIDGFVNFNNRYGQAEGDRFLKKVAETVRRSIRAYDEAFRAGGDEFCAILYPADDKVADDVTERVSQVISKSLFEGDKDYMGQSFSISAGVVFYPGHGTLPEALLHAATQALYQARMARASTTS